MPNIVKNSKAITLVSLIITIVLMLILSLIVINAVNHEKLIGHAENASERFENASDEKEIELALAEWESKKYAGTTETFLGFMQNRLSGIVNSSNDITQSGDYITITTKDGKEHEITDVDSSITLSPSTIDTTTLSHQRQITATSPQLDAENIVWTSSDTDVVTVTPNGTTCTITQVGAGTATVTASCGGNNVGTATVNVVSPTLNVDGVYEGVVYENSMFSEILDMIIYYRFWRVDSNTYYGQGKAVQNGELTGSAEGSIATAINPVYEMYNSRLEYLGPQTLEGKYLIETNNHPEFRLNGDGTITAISTETLNDKYTRFSDMGDMSPIYSLDWDEIN